MASVQQVIHGSIDIQFEQNTTKTKNTSIYATVHTSTQQENIIVLWHVMPKDTEHLRLSERMLEIYMYRYNMEHYSLKLLV